MKFIIRLSASLLTALLLALPFSCTRKSVDPGDSTSDQEALLTAYRALETALESKTAGSGGLDDLLAAGYRDEGADRDAVLAEAAVYFAACDSIRVSLNTQGMTPRIVRNRATVAESLKIESWLSAVPGSVMVEWCTGNAPWILEDGAWKLYGDQAESTQAAAVEVASRADVSFLPEVFGAAGPALGCIDAVIVNALFDSGATDQYSGTGWPAVTRAVYHFTDPVETTYSAVLGSTAVMVTDTVGYDTVTVDSVIIDFSSLDIAVAGDGISRSGTVRIGCTAGDSAGQLSIGFRLHSCRAGSASLSGSGTVTGLYTGTADSLNVSLDISVDTLRVVFKGYALVSTGNTADRGDDAVRIFTGNGSCQITGGSAGTWNVHIYESMPLPGRYGMSLSPAPAEYALVYDRFGTHPVQGCVFTDTLGGSAFGTAAYAELLGALNDGWIDPATGEAYPESVAVHYTEERRHRKGASGISGFIDDGFDVMPIIPDELRNQSRREHTFMAGACYGYPLYSGDGTALIRLIDLTFAHYTVVDTTVFLRPR